MESTRTTYSAYLSVHSTSARGELAAQLLIPYPVC
jgi:hypothetical protein